MNTTIALASSSPRREELLKSLDLNVRKLDMSFEEAIDPSWSSHDVALKLARLKNQQARPYSTPDEVLLTADTIVLLDDDILLKPVDKDDAISTLQKLSGQWHEVITGVCMSLRQELAFSVLTRVLMSELSNDAIEYYIDTYRPFDKAGSYGIQEWIGWSHISRIEGSYSNVMGLPTCEVFHALKSIDRNET